MQMQLYGIYTLKSMKECRFKHERHQICLLFTLGRDFTLSCVKDLVDHGGKKLLAHRNVSLLRDANAYDAG